MRNNLLLGGVAALVVGLPAYAQTAPEAAPAAAPAAQAAPAAEPAPAAAPAEAPAAAPAPAPAAGLLAGKGVIVMDKALQDQLVKKQHPDSFTGGATSLTFPIGVSIRDTALKALSPSFADGAEVAEAAKPQAYGVVLRLDGFTYKYDSMSSLGFAITPRVTVTLTAEGLGPDGKSLFRKAYTRQDFTAGAYVASFKPKEKVLGSFQKALDEIFVEIQTDLTKAPVETAVTAAPAP
jgi:hypothetical protein